VHLALPADTSPLNDLQPDQLHRLVDLPPVEPDATAFVCVDTWHCDSSDLTASLQVKVCALVAGEEGSTEERSEYLTKIWLVSPATLALFERQPDDVAAQGPDPT